MDPETIRKPETIALYPGCSLDSSSRQYRASLDCALEALERPCPELRDWSCCGASSAHAIDPQLGLDLALRNLAKAEQLGYSEILAPCAACFHRLASADLRFRREAQGDGDGTRRATPGYHGGVRVRNLLDFLTTTVGVERIRARTRTPLSGLRVACYYGCLTTRIHGGERFDDREYPTSMDHIVEALGATAIEWGSRTECCGGSLFLTAERVSSRLVAAILADAAARDAQCIAVCCPMCQNNLDVKQPEYRRRFDIPRAVPVVFVTQLMGLAFGAPAARVGLSRHVVPFTHHEMVGSHER